MATLMASALIMASCASKRAAVTLPDTSQKRPVVVGTPTPDVYVTQVADNQVYAKDIVGNISFNLKAGSKDITVPGSLHMRKDKVIRLQLFIPILGTEVGRLEFTPSYVLVIDRLHKEYIKADYSQVDFLQRNGINFYSLQALFWNQLFVPGSQKLKHDDMRRFTLTGGANGGTDLTLADGNMTYRWSTETATARIVRAKVSYATAQHGQADLDWQYAAFKAVGVKQFPAQQTFTFSTTATQKVPKVQVSFKMSDVKTTDKWDAQTEVSSKYKKVDAAEVLQKLLQM